MSKKENKNKNKDTPASKPKPAQMVTVRRKRKMTKIVSVLIIASFFMGILFVIPDFVVKRALGDLDPPMPSGLPSFYEGFNDDVPYGSGGTQYVNHSISGGSVNIVSNVDTIIASRFDGFPDGNLTSISIYIRDLYGAPTNFKCAVYGMDDVFIAETESKVITSTSWSWETFSFSSPVPITAGSYWFTTWCDDFSGGQMYFDLSGDPTNGRDDFDTYGSWPDPLGNDSFGFGCHCISIEYVADAHEGKPTSSWYSFHSGATVDPTYYHSAPNSLWMNGTNESSFALNTSDYYDFAFDYFLDWNSGPVVLTVYNTTDTLMQFTFHNWVDNSIYDPGWDLNSDGKVDDMDCAELILHFTETGAPGWIPSDMNHDGTVDIADISKFVLYIDNKTNNHLIVDCSISYLNNGSWNNETFEAFNYSYLRCKGNGDRTYQIAKNWFSMACEFDWVDHRFHVAMDAMMHSGSMQYSQSTFDPLQDDFDNLSFNYTLADFWIDDLNVNPTPPQPFFANAYPAPNATGVPLLGFLRNNPAPAGQTSWYDYYVNSSADIYTNETSFYNNNYRTHVYLYNTYHTTKTYTFYSDQRDGYFYKSDDTFTSAHDANSASSYSSSGPTFIVGQMEYMQSGASRYKDYRGVLSFNTSAIPDNAVMLSSYLTLTATTRSLGTTTPVDYQGSLVVSQDPTYTYPRFDLGHIPMQLGDYDMYLGPGHTTLKYPTLVGESIIPLSTSLANPTTFSFDLSDWSKIQKNGWTNLFLQCEQDYDRDQPNWVDSLYTSFVSGDSPTPGYRPTLSITVDYVSSSGWEEVDSPILDMVNYTMQMNMSDLYYNTDYYWYIEVETPDGANIWHYPDVNDTGMILWNGHKSWKFTTATNQPPQVTLISPLCNETSAMYYHDDDWAIGTTKYTNRWYTPITVNYTDDTSDGKLQFYWYNDTTGSTASWEPVGGPVSVTNPSNNTFNFSHYFSASGLSIPGKDVKWCVRAYDGTPGLLRTSNAFYPDAGDYGLWHLSKLSPYLYYKAWNFTCGDYSMRPVNITPANNTFFYADNQTINFTIYNPSDPDFNTPVRLYFHVTGGTWTEKVFVGYHKDGDNISVSSLTLFDHDIQLLNGTSRYWYISLADHGGTQRTWPTSGLSIDAKYCWKMKILTSNIAPTVTWIYPTDAVNDALWRSDHHLRFRVNDTQPIDSIQISVEDADESRIFYEKAGRIGLAPYYGFSRYDVSLKGPFTDRTFNIDMQQYLPFYGEYNIELSVIQTGMVFSSTHSLAIGTTSTIPTVVSLARFYPNDGNMSAIENVGKNIQFDFMTNRWTTSQATNPMPELFLVDENGRVISSTPGIAMQVPLNLIPQTYVTLDGFTTGEWSNWVTIRGNAGLMQMRKEFSFYVGFSEQYWNPANLAIQLPYDSAQITEFTWFATSGLTSLGRSITDGKTVGQHYGINNVIFYGVKIHFGTTPRNELTGSGDTTTGSDWGRDIERDIEAKTGIPGTGILIGLLVVALCALIPVFVTRTVPPLPIEAFFAVFGSILAFGMGFFPIWIFIVAMILGFLFMFYKAIGWAQSQGGGSDSKYEKPDSGTKKSGWAISRLLKGGK